jgi:hypothetical protein
MGKKNKPVYAFDGTTEGLRDALVHHFEEQAKKASVGHQQLTYRQVTKFLKRLIINKSLDENEEAA